RTAELAQNRADVNDRAALAFDHMPADGPRHVENAVKIGTNDLVPGLVRRLLYQDGAVHARIIDQNIDRPDFLLDSVHAASGCFRITDVEGPCMHDVTSILQ